jgi:uncharacterized membrane protein YphA (DoxX/SURF4 family)
MSTATVQGTTRSTDAPIDRDLFRRDAAYQSFWLLRIGFTVAPIVFGLDKFFNVLVNWEQYLAPWVDRLLPGTATDVMYLVGVVEIVAGLIVLIKPRYGAYLVAAWLAGIIINLLVLGDYYDVALRDFGLLLGAIALARLATAYDRPRSAVTVTRG